MAWKNAASVILVCNRAVPTKVFRLPEKSNGKPNLSQNSQVTVESETTKNPELLSKDPNLLIRRQPDSTSDQLSRQPSVSDLLTFVVQRSPTAKFMPRAYVFPGGAIEDSDFDPYWTDRQRMVEKIASDTDWDDRLQNAETHPVPRAPMFDQYRRTMSDSVGKKETGFERRTPPEWAARVAAVRELYEECSILSVFDHESNQSLMLGHQDLLNVPELSHFSDAQASVRQDARAFKSLFEKSNRFSLDFTKLLEWSNWLTPLIGAYSRRFDTLFFLLPVDRALDYGLCSAELQNAMWEKPAQILREGYYGTTPIAPPQSYELSRLARFKDLSDLREFAENRARSSGLVRICPQLVLTGDGVRVAILPENGTESFLGDDQYDWGIANEASEMIGRKKVQKSADELRFETTHLHRAEFRSEERSSDPWTRWRIYCGDFNDPSKHIAPISEP